jgi:hypothetical protein
MEVVIFSNQKWQEIPEQDNPAMACNRVKDVDNFGALVSVECVMIFKGCRDAYTITGGGFVVASVPKEGDISKRGVFWALEDAERFAEMIALKVSG